MIVALIPAHNEAAGIVGTIESLQAQTVPPDRIIVSADNCTDDTVSLAQATGAEVYETVDNTFKKAGALNQALERVLDTLGEDDLVLVLDADGSLALDWVEAARRKFRHSMGAISGVCRTRQHPGVLSHLQAAEYAQDFRRVARRAGRTNVLSGAAAIFSTSALRDLYRERGRVYDENSLTEDFEVTLALKMLGYRPRCFKDLVVTTDVMTTWKDLWTQRLRWQRGTIETLRDIGYNRVTRGMFFTLALCYLSTFMLGLTVVLWAWTLVAGLELGYLWLVVMPVFMVEQFVTARGAGPRAASVAGSMVPMWAYGLFRSVVYWAALSKVILKSDKIWIT